MSARLAPPPPGPVWAAAWRRGIDYHTPTDDGTATVCGRSTASRTGLTLTEADAREAGMTPCPRCYPAPAGAS